MVNIVMGPEGSGKTKLLIDAISRALKTESGSMVCIEKGHTLRYDVDHRVRLIDASEYSIKSYTLLQGFISWPMRVILKAVFFTMSATPERSQSPALASAARTTPGPETPTLMTQSGSPG